MRLNSDVSEMKRTLADLKLKCYVDKNLDGENSVGAHGLKQPLISCVV